MHALRHEGTHVVIDPPAGEDDLRLMPDLDRPVREIEGVDPDAMSADQAGREAQEIPFRRCRVEHVMCGKTELLEDHRHFVDKGDVDVALRILDHLGSFRRLDALGHKDVAVGYRAVDAAQRFDHGVGLTGHHLGDTIHRVFAVSGVDAFRRITEKKVAPAAEPGRRLQRRSADVLGNAGINRAFEHHDRAFLQALAHRPAGTEHRVEVWLVLRRDRGWYRYDEDVAVRDLRVVRANPERACPQRFPRNFIGTIDAVAQFGDAALADVVADNRKMPGKRNREREAHIAQANNGDTSGWGHDSSLLNGHGQVYGVLPVAGKINAGGYIVSSFLLRYSYPESRWVPSLSGRAARTRFASDQPTVVGNDSALLTIGQALDAHALT